MQTPRGIQKVIAQLIEERNALAHQTLMQPPATFDKFNHACGHYVGLTSMISRLQELIRSDQQEDE